ncbi:ATP-binding protein [Niabella beijingensis]|uniref:sensor histidine kinase n=1 Tax=Niabella beijingensis TaxID=2872700 RepID=UPI001CBABB18|nr:ATP-binding protein [Niabella beijingensis]MBZ4190939.1 CHASE3 domain-containing protein [Niabella beijingensis]
MIKSLNKIRIGYVLSSLLLLTSYILILSTNRRLQTEKERVVNSYILINKLGAIKMAVSEAETNVREYLLNKNEKALATFHTTRANLHQLHQEVRRQTQYNSQQAQSESVLQTMTEERMAQLATALIKGRASVLGQANNIYTQIQDMTAREEPLMRKRMTRLDRFYNSTETLTILSLFMAAIAVVYAVLTFNSQYRQKRKADKTADVYRNELEENVKQLQDKNTTLKELKGMEKLATIGRVARVVAHEVRNPLTNISLATEQLQDLACIRQDPDGQLLLGMIERNSTRIGQMVSDLLNATKFMQLDKQQADLNQLLDESLAMARDRLVLRKIEVVKNYSDKVCDVMVDKERIRLAFLNIIVNAIEAMREGAGILELTTKRDGDRCIVEVRDNGSGMDEATLQNLFEPYFTMKKKGNGLGLTNSQNIVLNHKGNIKVSSEPGKGSLFVISLNVL